MPDPTREEIVRDFTKALNNRPLVGEELSPDGFVPNETADAYQRHYNGQTFFISRRYIRAVIRLLSNGEDQNVC